MKNLPPLQLLTSITQLPAPYQKRNCTDLLCIILGSILTLIMFILAITLFNFGTDILMGIDHFYRANFPSDSQGRLCGIDQGFGGYPYVYFVNPPDIARRVCVAQCPKPDDKRLACVPTEKIGCMFTNSTGYQVLNYPNEQVPTRSGYFCYPTQPTLLASLLSESKLSNRNQFFNSLDTIQLCFYLSLAFCFLYLLCVQFKPRIMNYIVPILGCLMILACAICIIVYESNQHFAKVLELGALFGVLAVIGVSVWRYRTSWRMHGIFLEYGTNFVKGRPAILAYIVIFWVILFAFVVIIVFVFTAYWTSGALTFDGEKDIFYELQGGGPIALTVLLALQTIWGFNFIKSAFNFCTSAAAARWYYGKQEHFCYPFKLLLCKHLGSVIAGSFMSGFFSAFDFLFDVIKPSREEGAYNRFCGIFSCCTDVFDLVREDALPYIALTGNPYCNSSRYCEYLCLKSIIMDSTQSTSRSYRISAHFLITGIMLIMALYIKGQISINTLFIIALLSLATSTLFISFHCDIAEAIQIILLTDEQFSRRARNDDYEVVNQDSIRKQLGGLQLHGDLVDMVKRERLQQAVPGNLEQK